MGKMVRLRHPEHEGLVFGPNSEIKFGIRGGFPPGIVEIDEDDPLYALLLELEPTVEIVNEGGPAQVFLCPIHPDKEFKAKIALLAHLRSKGHEKLVAAEAAEDDQPEA